VNTAYAVLRAPLSRARYLVRAATSTQSHTLALRSHASTPCAQLRLQGAVAPGGDDGEGTMADPALLSEVMEAREEAEAARGDAAALAALSRRAAQHLHDCEADVRSAFGAGDAAAAAAATARLSYLTKLAEDLADSQHAAATAQHAAAAAAAAHRAG
jgi:DnaJ-domain-containing protein 1